MKFLERLKAGDAVVVERTLPAGRGHFKSLRYVRTVWKVTSSKIGLDNRLWYRATDGAQVSKRRGKERLLRLATGADLDRQQDLTRRRDQATRDRQRRDEQIRALTHLFPDMVRPNIREAVGAECTGEYEVEFYGLTHEEIARLAELLTAIAPKASL